MDLMQDLTQCVTLTQVFGGSQPTPNPEEHHIGCFEDGIAAILSGEINGFECHVARLGRWHPEAVFYRIRRWGDCCQWQFKVVQHGVEGSGIYVSSWEELLDFAGDFINDTDTDNTAFRAI